MLKINAGLAMAFLGTGFYTEKSTYGYSRKKYWLAETGIILIEPAVWYVS